MCSVLVCMEQLQYLAYLEHLSLLLLQVLPQLPILVNEHITLLPASEYSLGETCFSVACWLVQLCHSNGRRTHWQRARSQDRGCYISGGAADAIPELLRCKVQHRALCLTL